MNKRIIVSFPLGLYKRMSGVARREYRSVSSLIRESVLDRLEEEFTSEEMALIERGRKSFREGKGVHWRQVRRD